MNLRDAISVGLLLIALAAAAASWTSAISARRSSNESLRQRLEAAEDRRIERGRGLSIGVSWTKIGEEGFAQRYVEPVLECVNTSGTSIYRDVEVTLTRIENDPLDISEQPGPRTFVLRELLPTKSHTWPLARRGTGVMYTPDDMTKMTPVWDAQFTDGHGERWITTSTGELKSASS